MSWLHVIAEAGVCLMFLVYVATAQPSTLSSTCLPSDFASSPLPVAALLALGTGSMSAVTAHDGSSSHCWQLCLPVCTAAVTICYTSSKLGAPFEGQ